MSWKSDGLYQLVLREIDNIWRKAVEDGRGVHGPAPDYLVITQFANLSIQPYAELNPNVKDTRMLVASLSAPVIRQWILDAEGVRFINDSDSIMRKSDTIRGMFYRIGTAAFCVSADRKRVAIEYVLGPRYGLHRVLRVCGQGKQSKLEVAPEFVGWIS